MSFSVIFAVLALLALLVIFAAAWKIRGLKAALLVAGIFLVVSIVLYVAFVALVTSAM